MGPDPPGPPPRPPKTTSFGRPCEGFQGDSRLKALSSPKEYPGEMIRSATAKMTDGQIWTCVRTAPYPAFMNRWGFPRRSHATALAISYPYCPLPSVGSNTGCLVSKHPEVWLAIHRSCQPPV
jgi:hypothetical protein